MISVGLNLDIPVSELLSVLAAHLRPQSPHTLWLDQKLRLKLKVRPKPKFTMPLGLPLQLEMPRSASETSKRGYRGEGSRQEGA